MFQDYYKYKRPVFPLKETTATKIRKYKLLLIGMKDQVKQQRQPQEERKIDITEEEEENKTYESPKNREREEKST